MTPLRLAVIVGSTRESRTGDRIGRWFVDRARRRDGLAVTVVDLADHDPGAQRPGRAAAAAGSFVAQLARAEAFVVVTPEYNHSFPGSLKQAIDHAYDEWQAKPVGFVSYGCGSIGLHAVDQLRTVFTALHAVTMRDVVGVDLLDGAPSPWAADECERAADVLLDQLRWWGLALRDGRAARPYVS
ncbi:NAD(P)H-dependent oxidoreductase [Micromonospora sp. CPCC 205546]|uniref:NADPH-dependent FMN reductase n=1 Tax=Micromonospora sp. CPCC 205546 TaxID=3122397 RepID=UPI002FF06B63